MLHIRFNKEGKTEYGFEKPKSKQSGACYPQPTLIPRLPQPVHKQRIDYDVWKKNNIVNIDKATEFILEGLKSFLIDNPRYCCSLNQSNFETQIHTVFYTTSHNSLKYYLHHLRYLS